MKFSRAAASFVDSNFFGPYDNDQMKIVRVIRYGETLHSALEKDGARITAELWMISNDFLYDVYTSRFIVVVTIPDGQLYRPTFDIHHAKGFLYGVENPDQFLLREIHRCIAVVNQEPFIDDALRPLIAKVLEGLME